ncbi:hypothetical protein ACFXDJ_06950 [Streptomyces sp. NPDC059443]|uniref:hypothetical protein n=1 Tax=unclassified Streptomyces TaxID=2593676 RepID=UPI0036981857
MAYDPKKKTQLETGTDLTAAREDLAGRDALDPTPNTVADILTDRASYVPPYGSAVVPPAPQWWQSQGPVPRPVTGGQGTPHEISLSWRSGMGAIAPKPVNTGSRGLNSIGIREHRLYVGAPAPAPEDGSTPAPDKVPPPPATPTMTVTGPEVTAHFAGYWQPAVDPAPPVWTPIAPNQLYAVQVSAVSTDGVEGPRSEILVVNTHTVLTAGERDDVVPPLAPRDFQLLRMPDMTLPAPKVTVSWRQIPTATSYEVYSNVIGTGAAAMDTTRPGMLTGDVLVGTVTPPADFNSVVQFDVPVTVPNRQHTIKVRSKRVATRAGEDETKYSPCTELTVRTAAAA